MPIEEDLERSKEAHMRALELLKTPLGPNPTAAELEERRKVLLAETEVNIMYKLSLLNKEKELILVGKALEEEEYQRERDVEKFRKVRSMRDPLLHRDLQGNFEKPSAQKPLKPWQKYSFRVNPDGVIFFSTPAKKIGRASCRERV